MLRVVVALIIPWEDGQTGLQLLKTDNFYAENARPTRSIFGPFLLRKAADE